MPLSVRPPVQTLPSYSLTSDLLGFLRCGLQYRYSRISNLPPSHPVQLWFGQFIHAVLDESYREYKESNSKLPPWPRDKVDDIMKRINRRLSARNIHCWDEASELLGEQRAISAVNELGPLLFPLINQSEVRVRGARKLLKGNGKARNIERYEMLGVIDVVTQVELFNPKFNGNTLLELMVEELPGTPPPEFEVIVDYKGMKRPDLADKGTSHADIYEWQVHTYAHLRESLSTKKVIAGVLVYLNELVPTKTDLHRLQKALEVREKGVILPEIGSLDEKVLRAWKAPSQNLPSLSLEFRLKRAVRVIPITQASINQSLNQFDQTVGRIEKCLEEEALKGGVIEAWEKNANHEPTCKACDSKTFCPEFKGIKSPRLPGVKI